MRKVMIAGIGGASLGTEIAKTLWFAGGYQVFGCDISPQAYGLYDARFAKTFLVSGEDYGNSVLELCRNMECSCLIPGSERTLVLLAAAHDMFRANGIKLAVNNPEVIAVCADKLRTFAFLRQCGFAIPRSSDIATKEDVENIGLPCIVKPAQNSGGSALVFYATRAEDALLYAQYIRTAGAIPIGQEYIPVGEGEFTIGVLSFQDGSLAGSIALRRSLNAKLSIQMRNDDVVISSGYTQGHIADYPSIRRTAEEIAEKLRSTGPINVQGRMRKGIFVPFEINPRFSASVYLRAMAGFNEVDIFLRHILADERMHPAPLRTGWYLRSLEERYVPDEDIRQ